MSKEETKDRESDAGDEAKAESKQEAEAESKQEAEAESKQEAEAEPKEEAEAEPKEEAEAAAKDEKEAEPEPAKKEQPKKGKKKKGKKPRAEKAASNKAEPKKAEPTKADAKPAKAAREATSEPPPAKAAKKAVKAHGEGHEDHRKTYVKIWGWLLVLTILEVGVAYMGNHVGKTSLVIALVGLALTKAVCVAMFFMHLKYETKFMRWTVAFPMTFPALYAFILIAEGIYRALWGTA